MRKSVVKIVCAVSGILFAVCCVLLAVSVSNSAQASMGIIGGASGPTALFLTRTLLFQSPLGLLALASLGVFLISGILLLTGFIWKKANRKD